MSDPFTRAKTVAAALHRATDELKAALMDVEARLVELGLGVEASAPMSDGLMLLFGRHHGTWGLCVRDGDSRRPLAVCSRRSRVAAAHALPELLANMIDVAEVERARTAEARMIAAVVLNTLGKVRP